MKIRLAYGKDGLATAVADEIHPDIVEPQYVPGVSNGAEAVRAALRSPIGSQPLKERITESDTVGIVVNDITRATPYSILLPVLLEALSHVPDEHITIMVATGTHRSNTNEELQRVLGKDIINRFRFIQNDANDRESHAKVGTTQSGNDIWIHKAYLECDLCVLTGFIEPHFFAGFSGGGKACMPGMALLETILRNHSVDHIDHPKSTWGVTTGNPIWEEVQEAVSMCGPCFLLNVAMNREQEITGVFAGDLQQAHKQGCEFVKGTAMAAVPEMYDIVVTSNAGYPLDLNLYQAVKGMSAAAQIVKPGGAIVLAAECWDGIPEHGRYKQLLSTAHSPRDLLTRIRTDGPVQDMWQAQIHASICEKADVYLYSHHLSDEDIQCAMLRPCRDIAQTLDTLLQDYGLNASVAVLPEGPLTIPYLCK